MHADWFHLEQTTTPIALSKAIRCAQYYYNANNIRYKICPEKTKKTKVGIILSIFVDGEKYREAWIRKWKHINEYIIQLTNHPTLPLLSDGLFLSNKDGILQYSFCNNNFVSSTSLARVCKECHACAPSCEVKTHQKRSKKWHACYLNMCLCACLCEYSCVRACRCTLLRSEKEKVCVLVRMCVCVLTGAVFGVMLSRLWEVIKYYYTRQVHNKAARSPGVADSRVQLSKYSNRGRWHSWDSHRRALPSANWASQRAWRYSWVLRSEYISGRKNKIKLIWPNHKTKPT